MTHHDFDHIISSINSLSPDQMLQLHRELESKMFISKQLAPSIADSEHSEESAFDVARRSGLIGCLKSVPGSPTDLSTNPKHMEGFGRG